MSEVKSLEGVVVTVNGKVVASYTDDDIDNMNRDELRDNCKIFDKHVQNLTHQLIRAEGYNKLHDELLKVLKDMVEEYEGYFEGAPEPDCLINARKVIIKTHQVK